MRLFWILLAAEGLMSLATAVLYGADKLRAKAGKRRIRERTLLLCTWLFGAPGALIGIGLFRHKSKHPQFVVSAVLGFFLQAAAIAAAFLLRL